MIQKLNNFTNKSFNMYTTADNFFKQKNLIFGYNGQGKSSLAEGLINTYILENGETNNCRFFNKNFIKENLLLGDIDENGVLKGVNATFSKRDIDSESEIRRLQAELLDESIGTEAIKSLKARTTKKIDEIHKSQKGKLRIHRKTRSHTLDNIMHSYNKDVEEALLLENNRAILATYRGDDVLENKLETLEALRIPDLSIADYSEEFFKGLAIIFFKTYGDLDIPTSNVINWLNSGMMIHQDGDNCKFCGNQINYTDIHNQIKSYNENEKQKSEIHILEIKNILTTMCTSFKENFSPTVIREMENQLDSNKLGIIFKQLENAFSDLAKVIEQFSKKIDNMEQSFILNIEILQSSLTSINEEYSQLKILYKTTITQLQTKVKNQTTLVRGAIGIAVMNNTIIAENLTTLKQKETEQQELIKQNQTINKSILELENKDSDHEDFRVFINQVLKDIEIDLELTPHSEGKNYIIQHSKITDTPLTTENISEGEKNLLALLFFYFELYSDKEQTTIKKNLELLVIDDPVSSLDDANKFYVLELMKNILKESVAQIVILTHVWNDFCQLSYKKNVETGYFEVYKGADSNSAIRKISADATPYRKLFKEIYEFSKMDKTQIPSDCEQYHIPNSMRRVFEEFLQFKSSQNIIPTSAQIAKVEAIIIESTNNKIINGTTITKDNYLTEKKKCKLNTLLTLVNVLSHTAQHNPREILSSAKFLMQLIEDMDKAHFVAMKI